jgi:hypothetical protein
MTPSTIDRPELEDRVRAALASRARSTVVDVPHRITPGPVPDLRSRRAPVLAAAVTVVVLGIAALAVYLVRDNEADTATEEVPEPTPTTGTSIPGTPIEGATGAKWFVLDMPGLSPPDSSSTPTEPVPGGLPGLQAFRAAAGFDGPSVWLEPSVGAQGGEGATEVTVGGGTAYVRTDGDVVTLTSAAEGGAYVIAAHLDVDDVVAFADGLQPRTEGGWDATVLPEGLVEVTEVEPDQPAAEHLELEYTRTDGAHYEMFVNPGGQAVFESWAREFVVNGGSIEALSFDGRPGLLIDPPVGETIAVWRPTDDAVVDFRTSLDREGLLEALDALRPVDEADWPDG